MKHEYRQRRDIRAESWDIPVFRAQRVEEEPVMKTEKERPLQQLLLYTRKKMG